MCVALAAFSTRPTSRVPTAQLNFLERSSLFGIFVSSSGEPLSQLPDFGAPFNLADFYTSLYLLQSQLDSSSVQSQGYRDGVQVLYIK